MLRILISSLVFGLLAGALRPQQDTPPQEPAAAGQQDPEAVLARQTLQSLADSIREKEAEVESARQELAAAADEATRVEKARALSALQTELDELRSTFASIALGADVSTLLSDEEPQVNLLGELARLLAPIIQELKDATEEPRQIYALRTEIDLHQTRARIISRGLARLDTLRQNVSEGSPLFARLEATRAEWERRRQFEQDRANVAQAQLQQRLDARTSIVESTGGALQRFFRNQGLSLLLGALAFLAVFLGMRLLYRPVRRWILLERRGETPFYARLIAASYLALTIVLAVLATLVVFWAAGDWMLLGLSLVFLFGLAWTSRQTLPRYLEQLRLFLNIGGVREGERILFGGVPYRVARINLFTRLVNDELSGGTIRVPLQDLVGRQSRQTGSHEPWFPCREGDWILLADGTRGKVIAQSPEFVQIVMLGGARQTWPTADFLAAAPHNLSAGFRITETFGVDYAHQAICTTEIPRIMRARLERDLQELIGADNVVNIAVEFSLAGPSSLDYEVLADFSGQAAQRRDMLRRAIQRSLVDACNEHGWTIPFTQVTIHDARA